jgi:F-type H+-transporting ATPase subunit a
LNTVQKFFRSIQILLFLLLVSLPALADLPEPSDKVAEEKHLIHENAAAEHGHSEKKGFMPGEMIMDHVGDGHDWHLADYNGHAVSIPLPVIIYNPSREKKLSMFMSGKFEHGHSDYDGYSLVEGQIVSASATDDAKFYDLSITKNVAAIWVSLLLMLLIMFAVARAYRKRHTQAPKGIQGVVEPLVVFLRDEVIRPSIGKGYERFTPFLLTVFFFIFFNNLLGLIPFPPGGANVTGNIAVTMVLSVFVLLITLAVGNKHYYKHIFLPDVPFWLYPIMLPIEIMGVFIKPFVLMLRLFANITAGHIIILGFMCLIFIFGEMNVALGYGAAAISVAFSLLMSLLEILVAFLQAYVFTLLSALYFGAATEEHH